MFKARYLHLIYSEQIRSYDIPMFSAEVIEKSNRDSNLFLNHEDDNIFMYRYPLIQYKITNKKQISLCLHETTDDIHFLLLQRSFDFQICKEVRNYKIKDIRLKYKKFQTCNDVFIYNIHNWIALNQDNYLEYQQLRSLIERMQFLEQLLEKQISIFMETMDAFEAVPLQLSLQEKKG